MPGPAPLAWSQSHLHQGTSLRGRAREPPARPIGPRLGAAGPSRPASAPPARALVPPRLGAAGPSLGAAQLRRRRPESCIQCMDRRRDPTAARDRAPLLRRTHETGASRRPASPRPLAACASRKDRTGTKWPSDGPCIQRNDRTEDCAKGQEMGSREPWTSRRLRAWRILRRAARRRTPPPGGPCPAARGRRPVPGGPDPAPRRPVPGGPTARRDPLSGRGRTTGYTASTARSTRLDPRDPPDPGDARAATTTLRRRTHPTHARPDPRPLLP